MCSSCTLRTVKLCQDKEGRDHTGKTYKEESWYLNHLLMLMCLTTLHTSFLLCYFHFTLHKPCGCVWGPGVGVLSENLGFPEGSGQSEDSSSLPRVGPFSISSGPSLFSPTCGAGLAAEDSVYEEVSQRAEDNSQHVSYLAPA